MMKWTAILAAILAVTVAGCAVIGESTPTPVDPLDAVRVESTRQAVAFQAEREALDLERERLDLERERMRAQSVDVFRMALPWVILLAGLGAAGLVGWRWLTVWELRARVIRRAPEEGEPIQLLDRDRVALPLRLANAYADLTRGAERSPLLAASAEAQERATMRQQAGNLALAGQAAETVKARTGGGDVTLMLPPEKRGRAAPAPSPVRVLPEPTREVTEWIEDVKRPMLLEVTDDD